MCITLFISIALMIVILRKQEHTHFRTFYVILSVYEDFIVKGKGNREEDNQKIERFDLKVNTDVRQM